MTLRSRNLAALGLMIAAAGCTQLKPGRCEKNSDCASGRCDTTTYYCMTADGAAGAAGGAAGAAGGGGVGGAAGSGGVGGSVDASVDKPPARCDAEAGAISCTADKPICDATSGKCRTCGDQPDDCKNLNPALPACLTGGGDGGGGGVCVQCVAMSDCGGTTPVCTPAHTCTACKADSECAGSGPHVCMADGHCASDDQVVIVDEARGCPDGGTSNNFCTLADGVAHLSPSRNVLIVVGGTSDRLILSTVNVKPVVIGRMNSAGDPGSIPATSGTALTVNSDTVVIRDLTVNLGGSSTSRGIAVTGATTAATILRVTASLGTGLGIDVENGAAVTVDESYVKSNSNGGILVNGATATIQNSVIASNGGYGVQLNNVGTATTFWFNTVVDNPVAAVCTLGAGVLLQDSIVVGPQTNCNLVNSNTSAPTFETTRAYHLTGHFPCPTAPASFPNHDLDGEPRAATPDCGADQFMTKG
ncbi:MAG TPA: right-handed parallel beta-helix repeat-containing protein [Polyangia bacterium]|nr:right-handed parallel beta-helix repeat-containing protein [Polyangia bacterium]